MNLKVLMIILVYYGFWAGFFLLGGSSVLTGYTTNINLTGSEISSGEQDTGGLFAVGVSFARFFKFTFFGVGLPEDTPSFINTLFILWQSCFTIFSVGFVISSIWNG